MLGRRWFGFGDGVCQWRGTVVTMCVVVEACAADEHGLLVDGYSVFAGGEGRVGDTRTAGAIHTLGGPAPTCIR